MYRLTRRYTRTGRETAVARECSEAPIRRVVARCAIAAEIVRLMDKRPTPALGGGPAPTPDPQPRRERDLPGQGGQVPNLHEGLEQLWTYTYEGRPSGSWPRGSAPSAGAAASRVRKADQVPAGPPGGHLGLLPCEGPLQGGRGDQQEHSSHSAPEALVSESHLSAPQCSAVHG